MVGMGDGGGGGGRQYTCNFMEFSMKLLKFHVVLNLIPQQW